MPLQIKEHFFAACDVLSLHAPRAGNPPYCDQRGSRTYEANRFARKYEPCAAD
jgi:hypothetical protein